MRETRILPIGTNTFRIYIDRRDGEIIQGRLTGGGSNAVVEFTSISRMIILLDGLLDLEERSSDLSPPELPGTPTYELEILFRQNSSWQGTLTWLEQGREESFRSVLELCMLLNSALGGSDSARSGNPA